MLCLLRKKKRCDRIFSIHLLWAENRQEKALNLAFSENIMCEKVPENTSWTVMKRQLNINNSNAISKRRRTCINYNDRKKGKKIIGNINIYFFKFKKLIHLQN